MIPLMSDLGFRPSRKRPYYADPKFADGDVLPGQGSKPVACRGSSKKEHCPGVPSLSGFAPDMLWSDRRALREPERPWGTTENPVDPSPASARRTGESHGCLCARLVLTRCSHELGGERSSHPDSANSVTEMSRKKPSKPGVATPCVGSSISSGSNSQGLLSRQRALHWSRRPTR